MESSVTSNSVDDRGASAGAREVGWFIANFMVAEGVYALLFLGTAWPSLASQTEVAEGVLLMAIIYVPVAFVVLYPVLRMVMRPFYRRDPDLPSLLGAWVPGAAVATMLLVGGEALAEFFLSCVRLVSR